MRKLLHFFSFYFIMNVKLNGFALWVFSALKRDLEEAEMQRDECVSLVCWFVLNFLRADCFV